MENEAGITLFGGLCVHTPDGGSHPCQLSRKKAVWLLGYLALHAGKWVPRQVLWEAIWADIKRRKRKISSSSQEGGSHEDRKGDRFKEAADSSLSTTAGDLKIWLESLPTPVILRSQRNKGYMLEVSPAKVDALLFLEHCRQKRWHKALSLMEAGAFFPECSQEWRVKWEEEIQDGSKEAIAHLSLSPDPEDDAYREIHPKNLERSAFEFHDKAACRDAMERFMEMSDDSRAYDIGWRFQRVMRRQYPGWKDPDIAALATRAKARRDAKTAARRQSELDAHEAAMNAPFTVPPAWLKRELWGRGSELKRLSFMLAHYPAVALTGFGGVGKTHLAAFTAQRVRPRFPHGVYWVDLSAVAESTGVATAVTTALNIPDRPLTSIATADFAPGDTQAILDQLKRYLSQRNALIVLDNVEHLLPGVTELCQMLLNSETNVRILITGRRAPGLGSLCAELGIPPFPMPTDTVTAENYEESSTFSALQFFERRAREAGTDHAMLSEQFASIVEIVRRLEGIPLAMEIVAARASTLPPMELLGGVAEFLKAEREDATNSERHRSISASVRWSVSLLGDEERTLLRRLCLFPASFSLKAAQDICASGSEEAASVLDSLRRWSLLRLLRHEGAGDRKDWRYSIWESVRAHFQGELGEEWATIRTAYINFYLKFAHAQAQEARDSERRGVDQSHALDAFTREMPNLRYAIVLAKENDPDIALEMTVLLTNYWKPTERYREAAQYLNEAREGMRENSPPEWRLRAYSASAVFAGKLGRTQEQKRLAESGIALAEVLCATSSDLSLLVTRSNLLNTVGAAEQTLCRYEAAIALFRRAVESLPPERVEVIPYRLVAMINLATALEGAYYGRKGAAAESVLEEAERLLSSALRHYTETADRLQQAFARGNRAMIHFVQRRYQETREDCEFAIKHGDMRCRGQALHNLGCIAEEEEEWSDAMRRFDKAIVVRREAGDQDGVSSSLTHKAQIGLLEQVGDRGAIREEIGEALSTSFREEWQETMVWATEAAALFLVHRSPERAAWLMGASERLAANFSMRHPCIALPARFKMQMAQHGAAPDEIWEEWLTQGLTAAEDKDVVVQRALDWLYRV